LARREDGGRVLLLHEVPGPFWLFASHGRRDKKQPQVCEKSQCDLLRDGHHIFWLAMQVKLHPSNP
jgi:hypothetical protein